MVTIVKKRPPARFLSRKDVMDRVCMSYPTIWEWMRTGKFPRGREIGGKIVWLESEIERWINERPIKKLKGESTAAAV